MKLSDLKNKKIAILGLGIENYALLEFLIPLTPFIKGAFEITVCDIRSKKELGERYKKIVETRRGASLRWNLGKNYNKGLEKYDIIFRVAGYPLNKIVNKSPLPPFAKGGTVVSSPTKLFFELCPTKNIIGVTGTNGKGTTSALITAILKAAGKRVFLGGNIGVAMFSFFNKIKKNDWVVLELSSFQLEDLNKSPHIAIITNITKDHLAPANPANHNFHKSMAEYARAKMNIFIWQKKGDFTILNSKFKNQKSIPKRRDKIKNLKSKVVYFTKSELESKLVGEHNKENIAAAVEAAKIAGIKNNIIAKTVKNFKGLEYRTEFVKKINGVEYYNDSFSVTPDSAITALKSFAQPIILIAGGADKGADFKELAKVIKNKVKFIVLLNGEATAKLKKEILRSVAVPAGRLQRNRRAGFLGENMKLVYNMKEAVRLAQKKAVAGDIVLLSPACASFGMFKNYKERGRLFSEEVRKIK